MANNKLTFDGLEELRAALRALPAELTAEGGHDVESAANGAAVEVRTAYGKHRRSGDLQNKVTVTKVSAGQFGAAWVVKSGAKHAWLFDNGSQARHHASGHPTGAMWGRTPPTHVFVSTAVRKRRQMYEKLKGLLARNGLVVSGEP